MSQLLFALGTATTSMGGFPMPPRAWMKASSHPFMQLIVIFILVWQAGHVPVIPSIIISILFLAIIATWKECEDLDDIIGDKKEGYSNPRYYVGAQKVAT